MCNDNLNNLKNIPNNDCIQLQVYMIDSFSSTVRTNFGLFWVPLHMQLAMF